MARVLVVDDEQDIRQVTRTVLERQGYTVLLAENGQVAVDLFKRKSGEISLVLLDLSMPVLGGEETATQLRRIRPDVPILVSSGFSESEAEQRFRGIATNGFIQKPYTAVQLMESVRIART